MEKEMATHSSVLAWEIPWTEEPGGLQSMIREVTTGLGPQAGQGPRGYPFPSDPPSPLTPLLTGRGLGASHLQGS